MLDKEIAQEIEKLSEALVLAEPSDRQALGELHTLFEQIGQWASESSQAQVAAAAAGAAKLLEDLILEEGTDAAAAMETLGRTVSALRETICDGHPVDEVDFPFESGPGDGADQQRSQDGQADGPAAGEICHPTSLPSNVDVAMFSDFVARQAGVLEEMERLVLAMEKAEDQNGLGELRRLIHTLKGESALVGLSDVERLCHATEDLLDHSQAGGVVDLLLEAKDWLARTFMACAGQGEPPGEVEEILTRLEACRAGDDEVEPAKAVEAQAREPEQAEPKSLASDVGLLTDFVSEAKEHLEAADVHLLSLETNSQDEEAINAVFRAFHTIKGLAGFLGLGEVGSLAHEAENLLDRARRKELELAGSAMDVSFDAVDMLKKLVGNVSDSLSRGTPVAREKSLPQLLGRIKAVIAGEGETEQTVKREPVAGVDGKLGEILVESGAATQDAVADALARQRKAAEEHKIGKLLVEDGKAAAKDVAQALRAQQTDPQQQAVAQVKEAIKVDARRLDGLIETIGELVIAESMVAQSAELRMGMSAALAGQLSQLGKITREIQEMGTSLRMVPMRSTFQKMARLVRDLARKAGKPVEFVMSGEDTELDKTVVDRIGDPLVHMVRNAVDHGLENSPEDRRRAGKNETGRVELRAFHKGGNIHIEIEDDGRGLDRDKIVAKARDRGLIQDDSLLTDRDIDKLIFVPGLSTAKKVTDVSGRGVGMDVVKRNIDALRGQVEITSQTGKGSTFSIRLPLTLAIIDGMVVRLAEERYIIPTLSIVRSIRPKREDLSTVLNRGEMLSLQGKLIPLFHLAELFDIEGAEKDPTQAQVVVVEENGRQIGLVTDELLGQQQIVIKSLGETLRDIPGLAGAAIMPDGRVGIILDVSGLVRLAGSDNGAEQEHDGGEAGPEAASVTSESQEAEEQLQQEQPA